MQITHVSPTGTCTTSSGPPTGRRNTPKKPPFRIWFPGVQRVHMHIHHQLTCAVMGRRLPSLLQLLLWGSTQRFISMQMDDQYPRIGACWQVRHAKMMDAMWVKTELLRTRQVPNSKKKRSPMDRLQYLDGHCCCVIVTAAPFLPLLPSRSRPKSVGKLESAGSSSPACCLTVGLTSLGRGWRGFSFSTSGILWHPNLDYMSPGLSTHSPVGVRRAAKREIWLCLHFSWKGASQRKGTALGGTPQ